MSNEHNNAPAVPQGDAIEVIGIKDGKEHHLGTMAMSPRMKAREIAREQFGHFVDDDGSDAELCFGALEQLIDHMQKYATPAPAPAQEVGLIARQFDLICQAIDKADTVTMDGDYMLDSDDCIRVVRVMQVLFDIAALRAKGGK